MTFHLAPDLGQFLSPFFALFLWRVYLLLDKDFRIGLLIQEWAIARDLYNVMNTLLLAVPVVLLMIPRTLFALFTVIPTCLLQERSRDIVTPRSFIGCTFFNGLLI